MRTRLSEYKATLSSGSLAVHIKQPSDIVLEHDLAASIDVYSDLDGETYSMTYDNGETAWKIAGSDTLYYIDGDINNPQVNDGVYFVREDEPVSFGIVNAVHAGQQGYTDAAKRTITEALRLIYDETQKVLLCSTAKKANIYSIEPSSETGYDIAISFNLTALAAEATAAGKTAKATAISNIAATDQFTIAVDWGTSAEDIKGSNPNATLSAILEALQGSGTPSPDIPEGVAERLAMILEHFGIKTISGYEFMQDTEVTDELEDIMQALDPELEQEVEYPEGSGTYMTKAQAITAEAMQIIVRA